MLHWIGRSYYTVYSSLHFSLSSPLSMTDTGVGRDASKWPESSFPSASSASILEAPAAAAAPAPASGNPPGFAARQDGQCATTAKGLTSVRAISRHNCPKAHSSCLVDLTFSPLLSPHLDPTWTPPCQSMLRGSQPGLGHFRVAHRVGNARDGRLPARTPQPLVAEHARTGLLGLKAKAKAGRQAGVEECEEW